MQKRFELQNKVVVWEIEIDERHKNEMDEESQKNEMAQNGPFKKKHDILYLIRKPFYRPFSILIF